MKIVTKNKKLIWAFVFNLLIVVFEIIGLIFSIQKHGIRVFKYYTENSNYFALIVSLLYCIYFTFKNKTKMAPWIVVLRFIATLCLTLTYVVVTLVLIPMFPSSFYYMLFDSSGLYQHLICPILSVLSFLLFESEQYLKYKTILIALVPTIFYGVVCIVLNFLKVIEGPYPFFYVYDIPWLITILSIFAIIFGTVLLAFMLIKIFNLVFLKTSKKV